MACPCVRAVQGSHNYDRTCPTPCHGQDSGITLVGGQIAPASSPSLKAGSCFLIFPGLSPVLDAFPASAGRGLWSLAYRTTAGQTSQSEGAIIVILGLPECTAVLQEREACP